MRHIENITQVFGLPAVVAINRFPTDTEAELQLIYDKCKELGVNVALSEVWGKGSEGGKDLAAEVVRLAEGSSAKLQYSYDVNDSIMDKIHAIVTKVYYGAGVDYAPAAKKEIKRLEELGYDKLPICMAKTQYSFSDTPTLLGAPENFRVTISNVKVSAGAGFVVVYTGDIMTMPGLPKVPSAEKIDVDNDGKISGLF